jgi:hypothetical protein
MMRHVAIELNGELELLTGDEESVLVLTSQNIEWLVVVLDPREMQDATISPDWQPRDRKLKTVWRYRQQDVSEATDVVRWP